MCHQEKPVRHLHCVRLWVCPGTDEIQGPTLYCHATALMAIHQHRWRYLDYTEEHTATRAVCKQSINCGGWVGVCGFFRSVCSPVLTVRQQCAHCELWRGLSVMGMVQMGTGARCQAPMETGSCPQVCLG